MGTTFPTDALAADVAKLASRGATVNVDSGEADGLFCDALAAAKEKYTSTELTPEQAEDLAKAEAEVKRLEAELKNVEPTVHALFAKRYTATGKLWATDAAKAQVQQTKLAADVAAKLEQESGRLTEELAAEQLTKAELSAVKLTAAATAAAAVFGAKRPAKNRSSVKREYSGVYLCTWKAAVGVTLYRVETNSMWAKLSADRGKPWEPLSPIRLASMTAHQYHDGICWPIVEAGTDLADAHAVAVACAELHREKGITVELAYGPTSPPLQPFLELLNHTDAGEAKGVLQSSGSSEVYRLVNELTGDDHEQLLGTVEAKWGKLPADIGPLAEPEPETD